MNLFSPFFFDVAVSALGAAALATSVFRTYLGRRSLGKMRKLARRNAKIRGLLLTGFADNHFDGEEIRLTVDAYSELLNSNKPFYRFSSLIDSKARNMLLHAVTSQNENLFATLAKEAADGPRSREDNTAAS